MNTVYRKKDLSFHTVIYERIAQAPTEKKQNCCASAASSTTIENITTRPFFVFKAKTPHCRVRPHSQSSTYDSVCLLCLSRSCSIDCESCILPDSQIPDVYRSGQARVDACELFRCELSRDGRGHRAPVFSGPRALNTAGFSTHFSLFTMNAHDQWIPLYQPNMSGYISSNAKCALPRAQGRVFLPHQNLPGSSLMSVKACQGKAAVSLSRDEKV